MGRALLEALRGIVEAEQKDVRLSAEVLAENTAALAFWRSVMGERREEEAEDGFSVLSVAPWRRRVGGM